MSEERPKADALDLVVNDPDEYKYDDTTQSVARQILAALRAQAARAEPAVQALRELIEAATRCSVGWQYGVDLWQRICDAASHQGHRGGPHG